MHNGVILHCGISTFTQVKVLSTSPITDSGSPKVTNAVQQPILRCQNLQECEFTTLANFSNQCTVTLHKNGALRKTKPEIKDTVMDLSYLKQI